MKNIVILGGGYAGINLMNSLGKEYKGQLGESVKVTLIDKNHNHLRKVLLFKSITSDESITIPFEHYLTKGMEHVQGEVIEIDKKAKKVLVQKLNQDSKDHIFYDRLIIALGSVMKTEDQLGIPLGIQNSGLKIKQRLMTLIEQTSSQVNKKKTPLRMAVVGSGISGIETAAEMAYFMEENLKSHSFEVLLFGNKEKLLEEASAKVNDKLEKKLHERNIKFIPKTRVHSYHDNQVLSENGKAYNVGMCVVTTGVSPNPLIQKLSLPVSNRGQLIVNENYLVEKNIYAIGDCAKVVDPKSNHQDEMTCKEAIPQAQRLAKILKQSFSNKPHAPNHKQYPVQLRCISLGPDEGFIWIKKWGLTLCLTGKLGLSFRKYTWNEASLVKK
ncbi:FAD-dependent oxidoreductase [Bacillus carboniphilus]|uniref:FAD-dependent oxidoreductase n=1 Tax=Bacillus carboniphilus TaxID=86663 RepID=A0ABY9JRE1_9BACI|nr:FAD-dependent oxidoreductase [Bacillus carboniphilus]WLR41384.1 FAD-dependent oxidoreductase [Bacillus carboniphilus]